MAIPTILPCDGCGQLAFAGHIARRLQRLEWATRFRPIHIQALLLAASAPESDDQFLYTPESRFAGLASQILSALSIPVAGKSSSEEVLIEFQKRGLHLAYALECPIEPNTDASATREILEHHVSHVIARIRRSLKPKRVLVISPELQPLLPQLAESTLGCPVFYTPLAALATEASSHSGQIAVFRAALPSLVPQGT